MTDTKSPPGPLALGAALAIIKAFGRLQPPHHRADPVTAGELAEVIQGAINATVLRGAIEEAMAVIASGGGRLAGGVSGSARAYDHLARARGLLGGGIAEEAVDDDVEEALFLALGYIRCVQDRNPGLHTEANGSPAIDRHVVAALTRLQRRDGPAGAIGGGAAAGEVTGRPVGRATEKE